MEMFGIRILCIGAGTHKFILQIGHVSNVIHELFTYGTSLIFTMHT